MLRTAYVSVSRKHESEVKEKEDPGLLTLGSIHKARHLACCYFQRLDIFQNKSTHAHPNRFTFEKICNDAKRHRTLSFLTSELYLQMLTTYFSSQVEIC